MIDIECRYMKYDRFQCAAFRKFCHQLDADIDSGELKLKFRQENRFNKRFDYENRPMRKGVMKIHNVSNLHLREKEVQSRTQFMFRAYLGRTLVYNGNNKAHFDGWKKTFMKKEKCKETRHVVFKNHSETYLVKR
jgi:hypothetical protein